MTVSNRQLVILAVVAAVLVTVTVLFYGIERKPAGDLQEGALLVQGLDLDKVAKITVTKKDTTVTLEKKGKSYVVVERKGYPASIKKANELLVEVLGIRLAEKVATSAESHKELGVDKGGEDATLVEFAEKADDEEAEKNGKDGKDGEDGKSLVSVVVGKSVPRGGGKYVRLLDQDAVYRSEKSLWLATEVSSYIDTDLVDVKKDDVEEVRVTLPEESYKVVRNEDKKIVLDTVPEGKKQKDWEVESAFDALSSLSFEDVVTEPPEGVEFDATYLCQTGLHLTYTARLGKKDDKHYAKFACTGPPAAELERAGMIRADDPQEKLDEKDKILTAADKAREFNKAHGPWVYELSSWKAEKMCKPLEDLLEDEEKEPEEIAASHILVAYQGAEKAGDDIQRTKEEAKQRAEELLEKVKQDGADFAETAKSESDGPSKDKGGDLGTFKKGAMHKNFEEAAWKLEIDQISDVVETPFGFHIIKRTK